MFIRVIVFVNIELRNIVYGWCSRPPPPRPASRPDQASGGKGGLSASMRKDRNLCLQWVLMCKLGLMLFIATRIVNLNDEIFNCQCSLIPSLQTIVEFVSLNMN
jgi:hypothetical protein